MLCHGAEVLGVGGVGDGFEDLFAHPGRDVEFFGGGGEEEHLLDVFEFGGFGVCDLCG